MKGISHVAIGVSDMVRSLPFYRDLLGLEVMLDTEEKLVRDRGTRFICDGRRIVASSCSRRLSGVRRRESRFVFIRLGYIILLFGLTISRSGWRSSTAPA